jgi:6-phospho-beta-glucosidase
MLLNFTNPAGLVTEALCRHTSVPTIGLCNVPWGVTKGVATGLDVPFESIELDYVGLNHLSWVRGFRVDGVDVTDRVLDDLRSELGKRTRTETEPDWNDETIAFLRAIPNYYLLYYYETAAMLAHQAATPTRAAEVMAVEESLLEQYRDEHLDTKPAELEQRGGAYYSETAAALMADLWTDAGTVHVVDVPNQGAIPGFPDDVVVEVAARIDRDGAHPIPVAPLRADVDALVRTVKDFELLTVEAAVHGDEQAALLALVTNPLGPPAHAAPALWKRLREVHAGLLGRLDA